MNKLFCSVLIVVVYAISVDARYVDPDGLLPVDALMFNSYETSKYGDNRKHPVLKINRPHKGADFSTLSPNKNIHAAAKGKVSFAGQSKGYGNMVEIQHDTPSGKYMTRYAHLDEFGEGIQPGALISEGQPLGTMGNTGGYNTGPHLHVEINAWDEATQSWIERPIDPRIGENYRNIGNYNSIEETPFFQNNLMGPRRADGSF